MRVFALLALAMAAPAFARDAPVATFHGFALRGGEALDGDALAMTASREPLWSADPAFRATPVKPGDFSAAALLDFSALGEGDVAGLAVRQGADRWISIQIEPIEPADLVAVRLRDGPASPPAGRLVYTTAIPGSFERRVRLRIDRHADGYRLLFADRHGLWQVLAEDVAPGFTAPVAIGPFATDGADPG